MTLKDIKPGQKVKVLKINRGVHMSRRLFQIGLIPGAELTVISQHPFRGPIVFELGNATFALGQGAATAVEVRLSDN